MRKDENVPERSETGRLGVSWARSGGEATALFNSDYLAADGIENVIRVLDQVETGNIPQLEFIELNACTSGCVGGVLTIQNPFIAKARLQTIRRYLPVSQNKPEKDTSDYIPESYLFDDLPEYQPISRLGNSIAESMRMMADIQKLRTDLPGIDCGACGAPTCKAFAEDIIKKLACLDGCPIIKVASDSGKEERI